MRIRLAAWAPLSIAFALGAVTLEAIAHWFRSSISDDLALPGAIAGTIGGIVGIYDIPSAPWATVCVIGNFLFYSALWWAVLSIARRRLTIGSSDRGAASSLSQGEGR